MKLGLKVRLIISYVLLSMFLVFSLSSIANILLEKHFQSYVQERQEEKNLGFVQSVLAEFDVDKQPSKEFMVSLGQSALSEGIVLMVSDTFGNEIFCMSCYDNVRCENMINAMEQTMRKRYPNFEGRYIEKSYPLSKDGQKYGVVSLGFYGPFYYSNHDIKFMNMLNNLFIKSAFVFLFIALIVGYIMASRISKPIKAVTIKTNQIEKGNYSDRIELKSNTAEIEGLIGSVNTLASTLELQQQLKKRMANDYAHEFRTPLAAIQSNLEGILDGVFEPTPERVESVHAEILKLSRMVSDIDKIVEIESDSMALNKEPFDFCVLLKQTLLTFEADLKEKNLTLIVEAKPCKITADRDKISRVIVNLISNAIKYTEHGGEISVIANEGKNNLQFSISDTGVGIADKDLPHIFEHLYRADISRARNTGGSGIGLSVVKAIINAHNGKIDVQSEVGKGSTFIVTIPKK